MLRRSATRCFTHLTVPNGLQGLTTPVNTAATARELFDGCRYALLDCGGTIWEAEKPVPGINEALDYMRNDLGLQLRFITNNATASRDDMVANKFHKLGMTHVRKEEIFSSAYAAQVTLRRHGSDGRLFDKGNVLVLGNDGLNEELQSALAPGLFTYGPELKTVEFGRTNCDGEPLLKQDSPYDIRLMSRAWNEPLLPPPKSWACGASSAYSRRGVALKNLGIAAVVIGLDFKFTPTALALAAMVLQQHRQPGHQKALFVATNKDPQMPTPGGWLMPGCGSLVAALETAAGRKPDVVCGKPTTKMFRLFQDDEELHGLARPCPSECVMFGDRLSTDIAFGNSVGARTVHVRTGCETIQDVPAPTEMDEARRRKHIPHFFAESLPSIIEAHRGARFFAVAGRPPRSPHVLSTTKAVTRPMLRDWDTAFADSQRFRDSAKPVASAAASASQ